MDEKPQRVLVIGVSASGKSTFARRVAKQLELPLHLMDAIMWRPGWQYIGDAATDVELFRISEEETWLIEGYITKRSRTDLFARADVIMYLDYSPMVCAMRYIKRWWLHRRDPRPEIPGCPEKFSFRFLWLVWTKGEAVSLERFLAGVQDQRKIVRFKTPRAAEDYLKKIT